MRFNEGKKRNKISYCVNFVRHIMVFETKAFAEQRSETNLKRKTLLSAFDFYLCGLKKSKN